MLPRSALMARTSLRGILSTGVWKTSLPSFRTTLYGSPSIFYTKREGPISPLAEIADINVTWCSYQNLSIFSSALLLRPPRGRMRCFLRALKKSRAGEICTSSKLNMRSVVRLKSLCRRSNLAKWFAIVVALTARYRCASCLIGRANLIFLYDVTPKLT